MNLNDFAVEVSKKEGGAKNVDIAQIKEVIKITLDLLAEQPFEVVADLLAHRSVGQN